MNVYLMRHGETDWNRQGLVQGSADIPLNEHGRELARHAADGLHRDGVRFDIVYSSPYIRALETASIIAGKTLIRKAEATHSPLQMISEESGVIIDSRIREMEFGKFEGVPIGQLRTNKDYIEFNKCFDDPVHYVSLPPAESFDDVFYRVCSFLKKEIFPRQGECENLLVVCHGAVLRSFISVIKRLMLSQYWSIHQPNCCISIARVEDKEICMVEENRIYDAQGRKHAPGMMSGGNIFCSRQDEDAKRGILCSRQDAGAKRGILCSRQDEDAKRGIL